MEIKCPANRRGPYKAISRGGRSERIIKKKEWNRANVVVCVVTFRQKSINALNIDNLALRIT